MIFIMEKIPESLKCQILFAEFEIDLRTFPYLWCVGFLCPVFVHVADEEEGHEGHHSPGSDEVRHHGVGVVRRGAPRGLRVGCG